MNRDLAAALPGYTETEEVALPLQMSSPKLAEARDRMPVNVLSNVVWLVLNMLVRMWYTPYLIAYLGVAVYGLVPLIGSVTDYMTILTQGFNTAVDRLLMIDLARDDFRGANRTFNTSIVASLTLAAILLPISAVFAWFTPQLFNVPVGHEQEAQWLAMFTTTALLLTTFASSFAISSYALHRFDLRLLINVIRLAANVGIVIVLFIMLPPQLWQVGVSILLSSLLLLLGHSILWRKLTPQMSIKLKLYDPARLKDMLGLSGWVLVNQIGALLFLNIDLIVANRVFGAEVAGRYGAVLIFPALLRTLVGTIDGVLVPIVMTLYAQNNRPGMVRFFRTSVKFIGLIIALPIGLLCGLGRPVLSVWLGPKFSDLSWLVIALISHLCVNVAVVPLFSLQVAANKVRVPGIVTLAMGIVNAILAVTLALWSGWGYISIAIAGAIVLTAKNTFFTPVYAARILNLPWHALLACMIPSVVGCLGVGLAAYGVSLIYPLTNWGQLALAGGLIAGPYAVAAYFLGMDASNRDLVNSEVRRLLSR
jgi:O-antigen/teichoic acid export membrane protein